MRRLRVLFVSLPFMVLPLRSHPPQSPFPEELAEIGGAEFAVREDIGFGCFELLMQQWAQVTESPPDIPSEATPDPRVMGLDGPIALDDILPNLVQSTSRAGVTTDSDSTAVAQPDDGRDVVAANRSPALVSAERNGVVPVIDFVPTNTTVAAIPAKETANEESGPGVAARRPAKTLRPISPGRAETWDFITVTMPATSTLQPVSMVIRSPLDAPFLPARGADAGEPSTATSDPASLAESSHQQTVAPSRDLGLLFRDAGPTDRSPGDGVSSIERTSPTSLAAPVDGSPLQGTLSPKTVPHAIPEHKSPLPLAPAARQSSRRTPVISDVPPQLLPLEATPVDAAKHVTRTAQSIVGSTDPLIPRFTLDESPAIEEHAPPQRAEVAFPDEPVSEARRRTQRGSIGEPPVSTRDSVGDERSQARGHLDSALARPAERWSVPGVAAPTNPRSTLQPTLASASNRQSPFDPKVDRVVDEVESRHASSAATQRVNDPVQARPSSPPDAVPPRAVDLPSMPAVLPGVPQRSTISEAIISSLSMTRVDHSSRLHVSDRASQVLKADTASTAGPDNVVDSWAMLLDANLDRVSTARTDVGTSDVLSNRVDPEPGRQADPDSRWANGSPWDAVTKEQPITEPAIESAPRGESRPVDQLLLSELRQAARSGNLTEERTLRLDVSPAEYGELRIEVVHTTDGVSVHVSAAVAETHVLLEQSRHDLQAAMGELFSGRVTIDFRHGGGDGQAAGDDPHPFEPTGTPRPMRSRPIDVANDRPIDRDQALDRWA